MEPILEFMRSYEFLGYTLNDEDWPVATYLCTIEEETGKLYHVYVVGLLSGYRTAICPELVEKEI